MSGGILLGTFLLGDWEEIKFNRDLHTLICWWKHTANEKPFRRGCCLCIVLDVCSSQVGRFDLWWGRGLGEVPLASGLGAARLSPSSTPGLLCAWVGTGVTFFVSSAPKQTSAAFVFKSWLFMTSLEWWLEGVRSVATVCVFAGGVNTASLFIFMGCCRNWVKMRLKKYQSPDPAMYLCTLCSPLHFLVFFHFTKAKRIAPSLQSCQCCPWGFPQDGQTPGGGDPLGIADSCSLGASPPCPNLILVSPR